jgi:hypothetical protein
MTMAESKSKSKGTSGRSAIAAKAGYRKLPGNGKVLQKIRVSRNPLVYREELRDIRTTPESRAAGRYRASILKRLL